MRNIDKRKTNFKVSLYFTFWQSRKYTASNQDLHVFTKYRKSSRLLLHFFFFFVLPNKMATTKKITQKPTVIYPEPEQ